MLRLGSPLFHFGILMVLASHVMGLGIPKPWTEFFGISEGLCHFMAVSVGSFGGVGEEDVHRLVHPRGRQS
jgi:nitrate reductase gamma subunit